MKILYYLKYKEVPMFQWQKYHIFDELANHNINITLFNPLEYASIEESNEKVLAKIKEDRYDLFMTTSTDEDLYIDTLKEIKRHGLPTLLICFDNLTVPFAHKVISPYFDLVWLTSIETKYLFDKWGVNSIFMPYASNPGLGTGDFTKDNESVLFIGTPYGSRCKMLNTLLDAGVPVTLYTNKQNVSSNFLPYNERGYGQLFKEIYRMCSYPIGRRLAYASIKNKFSKQSELHSDSSYLTHKPGVTVNIMMGLYNEYALALSSVSNRHTGVLKQPVMIVNLRSFEIPSAGGLLFSMYNPELSEYFEDGKEAVYYYNDDDMIDKANFYLASDRHAIRETIKRNAREKAIREHTWFCRFKKAFEALAIRKTDI